MNIGFDGKRTTQNLTGLGNYSRYIIRLLTNLHPENKYTIYAIKPPSHDLPLIGVEYEYPSPKSIKSYWRTHGIIKDLIKQKINVFHGLSNEIPYGLNKAGIRSVVTIHDLIFLRYPQYYPFFDRIIYKLKVGHAARSADKVIAISQQTKDDLIQYLGIKADRISVIYQNCDPIFHQLVPQNARKKVAEKYMLPSNYLLTVGTIEERKNLMVIVKALTTIENVHLVVVGRKTDYTKRVEHFIDANKLTGRVHFLLNVAHTELPAIYQQAELFIYPSRFEGFGIPIIEALHSEIPVIAATGSCLEEAGGPGSIYVDPEDDTGLAKQIRVVLENNEKRDDMIRAGRLHLQRFDDKKIADELMQLYKNVRNNA